MKAARYWMGCPLFLVILMGPACAPSLRPRTAEVMHPGGLALSIAANSTVGVGRADTREEDGNGGTTTGNSGPLTAFPVSLIPGLEMNLRFGVFPRCELGFFFPYMRLGGELRCAILDETQRSPVSLAGSAAIGYLPWRGGPWVRAGFDLSGSMRKYGCIRLPMHPGWLRCSSVTYSVEYAPSSRLASRAPRHPRYVAVFTHRTT